jgi:hypothetical protein
MADIDKAIEEAWHQDALAAILPFESWERLPGETGAAYSAFCAFRDMGPERTIRMAVESWQQAVFERDEGKRNKSYGTWRNWCAAFRWRERAVDYDRYTENLKQTEMRKTIEAQGEVHRAITGKMLAVVSKKLDGMNPADLSQGTVTEWVETAIRAEREAAGVVPATGAGHSLPTSSGQLEINFTPELQGL